MGKNILEDKVRRRRKKRPYILMTWQDEFRGRKEQSQVILLSNSLDV